MSVCSYVGMQAIMGDRGDWQSDAQAVGSYMERALRNDASPDTVPLIYDTVQSPAQISAHFGGPTYDKGGSLLRMIRAMLGEQAFQTACQQFLAANRFSNALSSDLFAAFAAQWTGGPASQLQAVLTAWGSQRGFPLITATDASTASQRVWQLSQRPYNLSDDTRWPVWVQYSYRTAAGVQQQGAVWLNESSGWSASVSVPPDVQYVALNHNRTSFYRVVYPSLSAYDELRRAVAGSPSALGLQDRCGLVADAYWTQVDGYLQSWPSVLNATLRILAGEASFPVWQVGVTVLGDMWGRLRTALYSDTTGGRDTVRSYMAWLAGYASSAVQWEVDTHQQPAMHLNGMMQAVFGPFACRVGVQACLQLAARQYGNWTGNESTEAALPPANLRALTLAYGQTGVQSSPSPAESLFLRYLNTTATPTQQLATLHLEAAAVAAQPNDIVNFTQYLIAGGPGNSPGPLRFTDTVQNVFARLYTLNDVAQPTLVALMTGSPALFDVAVLPYDTDRGRGTFNTLVDMLVGGVQLSGDLDRLRSQLLTSDRLSKLSQAGQARVQQALVTAQRNIQWVTDNWANMRAAMEAALATKGA